MAKLIDITVLGGHVHKNPNARSRRITPSGMTQTRHEGRLALESWELRRAGQLFGRRRLPRLLRDAHFLDRGPFLRGLGFGVAHGFHFQHDSTRFWAVEPRPGHVGRGSMS